MLIFYYSHIIVLSYSHILVFSYFQIIIFSKIDRSSSMRCPMNSFRISRTSNPPVPYDLSFVKITQLSLSCKTPVQKAQVKPRHIDVRLKQPLTDAGPDETGIDKNRLD